MRFNDGDFKHFKFIPLNRLDLLAVILASPSNRFIFLSDDHLNQLLELVKDDPDFIAFIDDWLKKNSNKKQDDCNN